MLFLYTGKPGSFKTASVATKALEYLKEGRPVYTNIDGFDYEGVSRLPDDDDWRNAPHGSVIIYDEAQQFDFFKYKGREKLSSDGRITGLETHRHDGYDIILITQSPNFLHNHLLGLVGSHYHLHRAYGRGFADVFLWRYTVMAPDSSGAKNKAESHHKFKPNKKIFEKYKSTTIDTHKLTIPPIFFKLGGFLLLVLSIIGYVVFASDNPFLSASKIKENADIASGKKQQETVLSSQASSVLTDTPSSDLNVECRKGANVEKPECVQWFNNLSNNNGSVSGSDSLNTQVSYNPNKPFDDSIQTQISYEVTAKPVFSGCMKKNGRYYAYTQQGTILNQVSSADCQKLVENGDRPFNYFQQQPQQVQQQPTYRENPEYQKAYIEYLARREAEKDYSKNIQPQQNNLETGDSI